MIRFVIRKEGRLDLIVWDKVTKATFGKIKKEYPGLVMLHDWDKWRERMARIVVEEISLRDSFYSTMIKIT